MIQRWLQERRDGIEQKEEDLQGFVAGVLDGSVTRAQSAAWLAFVYCRGMTDAETVALTRAMTDSGTLLTWEGMEGPFVDKHSTGGVGDKVSLVLAPLWAAMGCKVPMISGRGLGITGGTLDKLEAIPGFRTQLEVEGLRTVLAEAGCFIAGQTGDVAPADRFLYALRNETGTVPSIPLITASILSKKLAEGIERLVLDVKCGSGAFMKTHSEARYLADTLVRVGTGYGVDTQAHINDMNEPLGCAVGNALEVEEAVACLQGQGPEDLREIVCTLSGEPERAAQLLDGGEAYEHWCRMVRAQGGDLTVDLLGSGCQQQRILAAESGLVTRCDAQEIGQAAFVLGAGRVRADDPIHPGVGLVVEVRSGQRVEAGQTLAVIYHDEKGKEQAQACVERAIEVRP